MFTALPLIRWIRSSKPNAPAAIFDDVLKLVAKGLGRVYTRYQLTVYGTFEEPPPFEVSWLYVPDVAMLRYCSPICGGKRMTSNNSPQVGETARNVIKATPSMSSLELRARVPLSPDHDLE